MAIKVYAYDKCGTCKKALKHLEKAGVDHQVVPIREQPPAKAQLKKALKQAGSPGKVFNTSGKDYREQGIKDQLANGLNDSEIVELLAGNGNLIKRPFVVDGDDILLGYHESTWTDRFGG